MKRKKITGKWSVFLIVYACLPLAVLLNGSCQKFAPERNLKTSQQAFIGIIVPHYPELVVWLKPGKTATDLTKWIDSVQTANGTVTIKKKCESCDSHLMLLSGPGILTYIQGNTASGGKTSSSSPATGEDGPVYNSINFNFPMIFSYPNKVAKDSVIGLAKKVSYSQESIKIAVLDTGIDTFALKHYPFSTASSSCIPGAEKGWNFVNNTANFYDDNLIMHGSTVTRFITNQAEKYSKNAIQILPVKTHDKNGMSNLFSILCAFAYAKERGVQAINASFGFYTPRLELYKQFPVDPNVRLLREFVKYYLTNNKILLFAAAGNQDDVNEHAAFDQYSVVFPVLHYPGQPRNLDQVSFYPASLARDPAFPNVIAVTTVDVSAGIVSPTQNRSSEVVDMGVNRDSVVKNVVIVDGNYTTEKHYVFNNPRSFYNPTAEGSSFATPITTGKLCANYYLFKKKLITPGFKKQDIWDALGPSFFKKQLNLQNKTRDGKFMIK